MAMKKSLTLLLAVIVVLSLFAGCAKDAAEPSADPTKAPVGTAAPAASVSPSESPEEGFKLPIVDTPMTFEMFAMVFLAENMVDLNDGFAFRELEKRTNIHIDWKIPTLQNGGEQFNLMLASTDFPDMCQTYGLAMWVGGLDANVDDGFIMDLTDMLPQYAPNYWATRTATDYLARDTKTDMGRVVSFRPIYSERQPTYEGPVVRKDLLDKAGYTGELITVDDWYKALSALKGVVEEQPYYFVNRDPQGFDQSLLAAFNVGTPLNGFIQINGKVQFSYMSDGMKEYLSTMAKWYDEGLIDKDFTTRTNNMRADYTDVLDNGYAMFQSVFTYVDQYEKQAAVDGYTLTPIKLPIKNAGDVRHIFTLGPTIGSGNTTLFPTAHDPEIILKWFDYMYTPDGALLYNYGVEGQGFTYVNGAPMLSELVVNNPDGIGMSQALSLYCFPAPLPGSYDWRREFTDYMSEKAINANFLWSENCDFAYELSDTTTMTSDESKNYSARFGDIKTYVTETIPRFITGELTVEKDWDSYIAQLKTMGIDECLGYWQAAYDRYLKR